MKSLSMIEHIHPLPWRAEYATCGESIGAARRSRIVDANGKHVVTLGTSFSAEAKDNEITIDFIVKAANQFGDGSSDAGG